MKRCLLEGQGCLGPIDKEHVRTRGAGHGDYIMYDGKELLNWNYLCRSHHQEKGQIAYSGMCKKYPKYKQWLIDNNREDILRRVDK